MHALLKRQLKRYFPDGAPEGGPLQELIAAVDQAYVDADDERALLERSLNLSSDELKARNDQLQADIAQRVRAESERDAFFRMSPDLLCMIQPDMSFRQVNPTWERVLGYAPSELIGRSMIALIHPEDVQRTLQEASKVAANGNTVGFTNRFWSKAGELRLVAWTAVKDAATNSYFAAGRDITEERRKESEAAQSQKLEAVGQLAAGVAHEINTPIQFVGDNVQFVRDSWDDLEPLRTWLTAVLEAKQATGDDVAALEALLAKADWDFLVGELPTSLEEARDGVKRVAELVRALKEFSHPDTPDMVSCDINQALQRTIVLARNEVKYVAAIETELGELPAVPCHAGALNQVFLNLLVNAAHAIEDRNRKKGTPNGRGTIRVATKVDGDFAVVAIGDSGCGIPPEIRERIFEPFFTTKEVGRGTGQGLALARKIVVERHRGALTFETTVDVGTTFFIRLPLRAATLARAA